jgi:hypothetical protein
LLLVSGLPVPAAVVAGLALLLFRGLTAAEARTYLSEA